MEQYEVFVGFDTEGSLGNGFEADEPVCTGTGR